MTAGFRNIDGQWRVSWLEAAALIDGLKTIPMVSPNVKVEIHKNG